MNLQEQLNRIQEMMGKITNEDFTDYGDISNPDKLEKDFNKYISTQNPRGVGKIHQSIGDNLFDTIKVLKNDFGFDKIEYAGEGHFGMAFIVNDDKILKLTNNEDEIRGIKKVLNKDIPNVIHYYDVKHYPDSNIYAILMDKVDLLSLEEETIYTTMYYEGSNYSDSDFWDEYDDDEIRDELIDKLQDRLQNPEEEDELEPFDINHNDMINYIEKYRELLNKLEENGVPTADLHGGNIGAKDGKLIHFDVMDF